MDEWSKSMLKLSSKKKVHLIQITFSNYKNQDIVGTSPIADEFHPSPTKGPVHKMYLTDKIFFVGPLFQIEFDEKS